MLRVQNPMPALAFQELQPSIATDVWTVMETEFRMTTMHSQPTQPVQVMLMVTATMIEDGCMLIAGNSTQDRLGCTDTDGDGYSDGDAQWTLINGSDAFPNEATQHADQDGDGFGDNPAGFEGDDCPTTSGTSFRDVYGCDDEDVDGMSDTNDVFLGDASQWNDTDSDGYGDEINGTQGDACPEEAGTSTQ